MSWTRSTRHLRSQSQGYPWLHTWPTFWGRQHFCGLILSAEWKSCPGLSWCGYSPGDRLPPQSLEHCGLGAQNNLLPPSLRKNQMFLLSSAEHLVSRQIPEWGHPWGFFWICWLRKALSCFWKKLGFCCVEIQPAEHRWSNQTRLFEIVRYN